MSIRLKSNPSLLTKADAVKIMNRKPSMIRTYLYVRSIVDTAKCNIFYISFQERRNRYNGTAIPSSDFRWFQANGAKIFSAFVVSLGGWVAATQDGSCFDMMRLKGDDAEIASFSSPSLPPPLHPFVRPPHRLLHPTPTRTHPLSSFGAFAKAEKIDCSRRENYDISRNDCTFVRGFVSVDFIGFI